MKKYIGFLIVLGFFIFGTFVISGSAHAAVSGCLPGQNYSSTTGQACPTPSTPIITVYSPSNGDVFSAGETINITWTPGVPGVTYFSFYKEDQSYSTAAWAQPNPDTSGSMSYTFPSDMPAGQYKTYAFNERTVNGSIISTNLYESTGYFTILSTTTNDDCVTSQPSLEIISPNGGETYSQGQQISVKWKSCSLSSNEELYIGLIEEGTNIYTSLSGSILNDGVEMLTIPSNIKIGKYKAYIRKPNTSVEDFSDNAFNITSSNTDSTPRIMYWYGKVNQHINTATSAWESDPDGVSGANLDKLTYCKKWYPNTTSVEEYKKETINTWRRAKQYEQSGYTSTQMSYKCISNTIINTSCVPGNVAGTLTSSLDPNSPGDMSVLAGTSNVEVLKIDLSNVSDQNVCLNGIQLGSSSNLNNFINNTKIIDKSTGLQVGQVVNSFSNNGSYYYSWVSLNPSLSIQAGTKKVFGVFSDFPLTAKQGDFKIGFWGLNFDVPGAHSLPQVVQGNIIEVNSGNYVTDPYIKLISPQPDSHIKTGSTVNIKWESSPNPLPNNRGGYIKVIIKRDGTLIKELITLNDGNEIVKIPASTRTGKYEIEYGTISPSSGGGDHYVKYGTAEFLVVTEATPVNQGCLQGEIYSSVTGKKCLEKTSSCSSVSDCSNPTIKRVLKVGIKGEDVKTLQSFLGVTADGAFGPQTKQKVMEWQASNSLIVDGIFGSASLKKAGLTE